MTFRATFSACLSLWALNACSHEDDEVPAPTEQRPSASVTAPDADLVANCDQAPDGTPCGEPGRDMHCLFDACVRNACGDSVVAEAEECDDGNERSGDSCSERCKLERCGNGSVDLGEECDDGNNQPGDGCAARCRIERCGNRVVDLGEQCDDGNSRNDDLCSNTCTILTLMTNTGDAATSPAVDGGMMDASVGDSGQGAMDAGADSGTAAEAAAGDSGSAPDGTTGGDATATEAGGSDAGPADLVDHRSAACKTCVEGTASACRDFQGSGQDLVASCLGLADPAKAQRCADAYFCSLNAADHCADDATRGAISCYCGLDRTIDQCNATSGAVFGPIGACIPHWEAATECPRGDNVCVNARFVALDYVAGFAKYLIDCTTAKISDGDCGRVCRPQ